MDSTRFGDSEESDSVNFSLVDEGPPESVKATTRYEILEELGRGGMGVVYRGRDLALDRDVAVKILLKKFANNPLAEQSFTNEAKIMGALQHPGVAQIYEFGTTQDGRSFHTMKLVVGETLGFLLSKRQVGKTDHQLNARCINILASVSHAMAYTHAKEIVHLDLKPENIMYGAFGEVHVMDWGLAQYLHKVSGKNHSNDLATTSLPAKRPPRIGDRHPGTIANRAQAKTEFESRMLADGERIELGDGVLEIGHTPGHTPESISIVVYEQRTNHRVRGTLKYMAPEQANGGPVDKRTDVFCLGAILCEILTGEPAYHGEDKAETFLQAQQSKLGPAHNLLNQCSGEPRLIRLAIQCLQAKPDDRPDDASFIANELVAYRQSNLERLEHDMTRFFELSLDLFCIAGFDGFFRRLNSNFSLVLGYSDNELLTKPFLEFVYEDDRDATVAVMGQLLEGKSVVRFCNRYRSKSGELIKFEWTAKSIQSDSLIFAVARHVGEMNS